MSDLDNPGIKAVITLAIIIFIALVAVITAKLVRVCMDSKYTDDNESVLSENTRELIRTRLSVIQFRKREFRLEKEAKAKNVFQRWKDFVKVKKKVGASNPFKSEGDETCVVNIEKANAVNGKIPNGTIGNNNKESDKTDSEVVLVCNGTDTKSPVRQLPSLKTKTPPPMPRVSHIAQKASVPSKEPVTPVPRGRPVSSKRRTMPNVTQTDLKRDPAKISTRPTNSEESIVNSDKKLADNSAKT